MSYVQKIGFYSLQTLLCLKNWRHWGDYLRSLKKKQWSKDRSLWYSACYFLFICLVVIINANILLSIC